MMRSTSQARVRCAPRGRQVTSTSSSSGARCLEPSGVHLEHAARAQSAHRRRAARRARDDDARPSGAHVAQEARALRVDSALHCAGSRARASASTSRQSPPARPLRAQRAECAHQPRVEPRAASSSSACQSGLRGGGACVACGLRQQPVARQHVDVPHARAHGGEPQRRVDHREAAADAAARCRYPGAPGSDAPGIAT